MSERKINLEEILLQNAKCIDKVFPEYVEDCKLAMIEFGKQLLELAAENAEIEGFEFKEDWMEEPFNMRQDDYGNIFAISKQSILNTIKQVE